MAAADRSAREDLAGLVRGAAVAAIASGVLTFVFFALHPAQGEPPPAGAVGGGYALLHLVGVVALVLSLFGLTAFYLVQHHDVGRIGLYGYLLAFVGTCGIIGFTWADGFYTPILERYSPALLASPAEFFNGLLYFASAAFAIFFIAGYVMFGVASFRAAVLPRDGVIAMTVGSVMAALPPPPLVPVPWVVIVLGTAILAVGLARIGVALWRDPVVGGPPRA
ncbi:MAG: hypothetical protein QOK05_2364 [Chloroflexota bacterium]|nr:hypothetical protein [Chloroflexota bacterium]